MELRIVTGIANSQYFKYVFALLAHTDKQTIDPLNINQWKFFILPTCKLDEIQLDQETVGLYRIQELSGEDVSYSDLREKVLQAYYNSLV